MEPNKIVTLELISGSDLQLCDLKSQIKLIRGFGFFFYKCEHKI